MQTELIISKPKKLKYLPNNCIIADIETTGLNPVYESIIEISALKIVENNVVEEFSSLVKPEKEISPFITKLTGITNKMVENAEEKSSVLKKFIEFTGRNPIVGHNIRFDLSFLNKNIFDCFNKTLENDYADTLYFARRVYSKLPSRKLTSIAEYLNIDTKNAHRAIKDCYMTFKIMQDMKQKLNEEQIKPMQH